MSGWRSLAARVGYVVAVLAVCPGASSCNRPARTPPAYAPPPGYGPGAGYAPHGPQGGYGPAYGGYPPQAGYTPGPYGAPGATPSYPAPASPQAPPPSAPVGMPAPAFPVANDPINAADIQWLRAQAGVVMGQLIAALPPSARARVEGIPFVADPTPGEVNAFAACDDQGLPLMAITDGLLELEAYAAQLKATDEVFGTRKLDAYVQLVARDQRPGQLIVKPPPGLVDPLQHVDGRKVARQHQIFEEQVAFVLGHELAHHHLGHTGCANGQGRSRGVSPSDLGRLFARALPVFNQPNEVAADVASVNTLLTAGARQSAHRWTEAGALLTLSFFASLDQLTPATIVFAFERSHPHPLVRKPIVQQTANAWRVTGGTGLQLPPFLGGG